MKSEASTRRRFLQWLALLAGAVAPATLARRGLAQAAAASNNSATSESGAKLADFAFTKLLVADLERSAAFYTAVCGLEETDRIDAEIGGRKITEILMRPTTPGLPTFVLLHYADRPQPASDEVILGFTTPDLEAFLARAVAAGGSIHEEIRTLAEMKLRVAFVKDVEGHLIEVLQRLA